MSSSRPITILLVEDSAPDARLVRETLADAGAGPYELLHVTDLKSALERLSSGEVQVILLDLSLPDSRGFETVSSVRQVAADTPIIVLTGVDEDEAGLRCIEAGAHDYLAKTDLGPLMLRRALSYALERHRQTIIGELESTIQRMKSLISAEGSTPPTGMTAVPSNGSLRERKPNEAASLDTQYRVLLDAYVDQIVLQRGRPEDLIRALVQSLGECSGGSRDLLAVHLRALEHAVRGASPNGARTYAVAGRLLALEMMGALADHYRGMAIARNSLTPPAPSSEDRPSGGA